MKGHRHDGRNNTRLRKNYVSTKDLRLSIERREKPGTTGAHALRAIGKLPAVLYGHGAPALNIAFDAKTFDELLHRGGRNGIFTLTEAGQKSDTALVRDVQRNPVTRKIIHVDLQRVGEHESVRAKLPIVTVGVARGVKDSGGVMDVIAHDVEIEGPANQLPDRLEIDVTELGIHEHVSASDIALPNGFTLVTPPDTTVVAIEASRTAQQVEEAATVSPAEQIQPEVIGEKPEGE